MSTLRNIARAVEPHPGEHFKDKIIAVSLAFMMWFAVNSEETIPQFFSSRFRLEQFEAALFDLGVTLIVVGTVMAVLDGLGATSLAPGEDES